MKNQAIKQRSVISMAPNSTTLRHRPVGDNSKTLLYVLALIGVLAIAIAVGIFLNTHVLEPGVQAAKDTTEKGKEAVRGIIEKPKEVVEDAAAIIAAEKQFRDYFEVRGKSIPASALQGLHIVRSTKGLNYDDVLLDEYIRFKGEKRIIANDSGGVGFAVKRDGKWRLLM